MTEYEFGTPITITQGEKDRYEDTIRQMRPYAEIARALNEGDIEAARRIVTDTLNAGQDTLEAITQRGIERAREPAPEPPPLPLWRRLLGRRS